MIIVIINCDNCNLLKLFQDGLDTDFTVDQLRQGLEPIDDQMLAMLTGTGSAEPDPEVEEQFKMN